MSRAVIEKKIEISAPPDKVWRVFIDPVITKQLGGEYVTDWKVGSSFRWKATDGKMYTNGTILELEPAHLLKHNLFSGDNPSVISVITYTFRGNGETTTLFAREDLAYEPSDKEYEEASEGWDSALLGVKQTAEKI